MFVSGGGMVNMCLYGQFHGLFDRNAVFTRRDLCGVQGTDLVGITVHNSVKLLLYDIVARKHSDWSLACRAGCAMSTGLKLYKSVLIWGITCFV